MIVYKRNAHRAKCLMRRLSSTCMNLSAMWSVQWEPMPTLVMFVKIVTHYVNDAVQAPIFVTRAVKNLVILM